MSKVTVEVQFEGSTRFEIDIDEYPQYFANGEARGGIEALARDVFYDEADLRFAPFETGATEFRNAFFDIEEQTDDHQ